MDILYYVEFDELYNSTKNDKS